MLQGWRRCLLGQLREAGVGVMEKPKRIQLSRAKDWKMPPNTVKVDSSTKWGNPFEVADLREAGYICSDTEAMATCVMAFRKWLAGDDRYWMGPEADAACLAIIDNLGELRGKNLACWCKPGEPCHADVLLKLANGDAP